MINKPLIYRRIFAIGLAAFLFIGSLLVGCTPEDDIESTRVVVVLDIGGIEDRGKNAMIWRGCTDVLDAAPVDIEVQEPDNLSEGIETLRKVATEDYDMVIVAASPLIQTAIELAEMHPETNFLLIDAEEGGDNVLAVSFPHYEAGYLMGVLAAEVSNTGRVGFLGGRDDDVTASILEGYTDGASSANPSITILSAFIGSDYEAAADTVKARETALALIEKGADGIFVVAGYSAEMVIETAVEKDVWAIAYESNLNTLDGNAVIASHIRRLDIVLSETILAVAEDEFDGGAIHYSIDDEVIECILNEDHELIVKNDLTAILNAAKSGLIKNNE